MNAIKDKSGVTGKNTNNLPVIRCPSLCKLVELVEKTQKKGSFSENIVFHPITDKPYETIKLSDLLGVELAEEGKTLFAKQPFYWE